MPGGDKTGPNGEGSMTGKQMGICGQRRNYVSNEQDFNFSRQGAGFRHGNGCGRGNGHGRNSLGSRGNFRNVNRGFGRNS